MTHFVLLILNVIDNNNMNKKNLSVQIYYESLSKMKINLTFLLKLNECSTWNTCLQLEITLDLKMGSDPKLVNGLSLISQNLDKQR